MTFPLPEPTNFARAALLALATISSDDEQAKAPTVFLLAPDTLPRSLEQMMEALAGMTKPVSCAASLAGDTLTVDCRSLVTAGEIAEHQHTTSFWTSALTRALSSFLGPDPGPHRVVLRGRGSPIVMTVDEVLMLLGSYNFRDRLGFDFDEPDREARALGAETVITLAGPVSGFTFRIGSP